MFQRRWFSVTVLALGAAGCTSLDPRHDYDQAARDVESSIGETGLYRPEDDALTDHRVSEMLRDGLTIREAVQICLVNNPRLQAELLRIGIARADLVQSELLSNPSLSFAPRWPDGGGLSNLQLGLAQNVAELWQIPFRRRAARHDLERVILDVARDAGLLAQQARVAYYLVLQVEREQEIARENSQLTQQLVKLTITRKDSGAGSEMDVSMARAQHADAKLRIENAGNAVAQARTELAKLIGLGFAPDSVRLLDPLPETPAGEITLINIVDAAREARLDWKASQMAVQTADARLAYERSRIIKVVELGISAERNAQWDKSRGGGLSADGSVDINDAGDVSRTASFSRQRREPERSEWVVGPSLSIDIPIFDQNHAQIAKAEYMLGQSRKLVEAIECDVTQDAFAAATRLATAGEQLRLYREELTPLRERVLTLSQDAYRSGRTTFLTVLEAQQSLLEARSGYVAALKNLATALVEVERVAGRPLNRFAITPISESSHERPSDEEGSINATEIPEEIP